MNLHHLLAAVLVIANAALAGLIWLAESAAPPESMVQEAGTMANEALQYRAAIWLQAMRSWFTGMRRRRKTCPRRRPSPETTPQRHCNRMHRNGSSERK